MKEIEAKLDRIIKEVTKLSQKKLSLNPWMDIDETCAYLRISKRTCQSLRDKKLLPFSKLGRKIIFRRSDLDAILERHYVTTRKLREM